MKQRRNLITESKLNRLITEVVSDIIKQLSEDDVVSIVMDKLRRLAKNVGYPENKFSDPSKITLVEIGPWSKKYQIYYDGKKQLEYIDKNLISPEVIENLGWKLSLKKENKTDIHKVQSNGLTKHDEELIELACSTTYKDSVKRYIKQADTELARKYLRDILFDDEIEWED